MRYTPGSKMYKEVSAQYGVSGLSPLLTVHHLNPRFDLLHDSNTDGMHTPTNECKETALYYIVGCKGNRKYGDKPTPEQTKKRIEERDSYVNLALLRKKLREFPVTQELKDGRFPSDDTITSALGYWKCKWQNLCYHIRRQSWEAIVMSRCVRGRVSSTTGHPLSLLTYRLTW